DGVLWWPCHCRVGRGVGLSALTCGYSLCLVRGATVLAAVTKSPGEMVVADVPQPGQLTPGNVIVRPEAVGICGSDFHLFSGDVGALSGMRDCYPRTHGHDVS